MNRRIILIWAQDTQNLIGVKYQNAYYMPWGTSNKEDLSYFRRNTEGNVVIMGYNTFLSMNKIALPKRINIVLTRNHYDELKDRTDIQVFRDIGEMQTWCKRLPLSYDFYIIGGYQLYTQFLNDATDIYQTVIKKYKPFFTDNTNHEKQYIFPIDTSRWYLSNTADTEQNTFNKYKRK